MFGLTNFWNNARTPYRITGITDLQRTTASTFQYMVKLFTNYGHHLPHYHPHYAEYPDR